MKLVVSETRENGFRSLEAALDAAKAAEPCLAEHEAVHIEIEGAVHLEKTFRITPERLPDGNHPVFFEGAGKDSVISGGVRLSGFTPWKDNIWRLPVPDLKNTRHLYIDGRMANRPRTEMRKSDRNLRLKSDEYELYNLPGEPELVIHPQDQPEVDAKKWSGIATTHTEIRNWRNLQDVEMIFNVSWVHRIVPIESAWMLEDGRLFIQPVECAFESALLARGVQIGGCPNYFENVFECLSNPLEWYYDKAEKMLYLCLAEGDTPENHEIIAPQVEQLAEIVGRLDAPVCQVSFSNLTFAHTTWLRPQKYGLPEIQASQLGYYRVPSELVMEKPYEGDSQKIISAVRVLASREISFEDCTFTNLGTGALELEFGTQDCRIVGNHIYEIAGSAVMLGEFELDRGHHPDDRREIVGRIAVENNLIHEIGRDYTGSVAIIAGYVQDVSVSHNEIHDIPYSAVSVGWGWGFFDVSVGPFRPTPYTEPTVCMRNRIACNHIHHCMMVLHDGGAIYMLGCMNGTVIAGNYIHNSAGFEGDGYEKVHVCGYDCQHLFDPEAQPFRTRTGIPGGIYLDEGSREMDIFDNVLHDVAIPLQYHNQIDRGYDLVTFHDNVINKRPGAPDFPKVTVRCAGLEPKYAAAMR